MDMPPCRIAHDFSVMFLNADFFGFVASAEAVRRLRRCKNGKCHTMLGCAEEILDDVDICGYMWVYVDDVNAHPVGDDFSSSAEGFLFEDCGRGQFDKDCHISSGFGSAMKNCPVRSSAFQLFKHPADDCGQQYSVCICVLHVSSCAAAFGNF